MDFLSFGGKLAGSRESQAMKDANLQSASARSAGGEAVCRPAFWSAGAHAAAQALGTGSDGLTSAQAEQQLARCGPNVLRGKSEPALIVEFLARFRNPLVLVLLAASGISALTGEEASFVITGLTPATTSSSRVTSVPSSAWRSAAFSSAVKSKISTIRRCSRVSNASTPSVASRRHRRIA